MTHITKISKSSFSADDAKEPIKLISKHHTPHNKHDNTITYIFGDIEGNNHIFNSTISIVQSALQNKNSKFLFLGDIYDYRRPNETIEQIKIILTLFNIPIENKFNESTTEISLIRSFRSLWKLKQLKFYKKSCIQYLYSIPHQPSIATVSTMINNNTYPIFLFGNKEVIFVQEIIECQHITKNNLSSFSIPANYVRKYATTDPSTGTIHEAGTVKHTLYTFTTDELNTMYTYLSLCRNYYIDKNKLYIHCYFNYKLFLKANHKFEFIISGHSKGYGQFKDEQFPSSTIIINDLTGCDIERPVNCITLKHDNAFNTSYNPQLKPPLTQLI